MYLRVKSAFTVSGSATSKASLRAKNSVKVAAIQSMLILNDFLTMIANPSALTARRTIFPKINLALSSLFRSLAAASNLSLDVAYSQVVYSDSPFFFSCSYSNFKKRSSPPQLPMIPAFYLYYLSSLLRPQLCFRLIHRSPEQTFHPPQTQLLALLFPLSSLSLLVLLTQHISRILIQICLFMLSLQRLNHILKSLPAYFSPNPIPLLTILLDALNYTLHPLTPPSRIQFQS